MCGCNCRMHTTIYSRFDFFHRSLSLPLAQSLLDPNNNARLYVASVNDTESENLSSKIQKNALKVQHQAILTGANRIVSR